MKKLKYFQIIPLMLFLFSLQESFAAENDTIIKKTLVYKFDIKKDIAEPVWRVTKESFEEATALEADYIIIHMNTYGGMVNSADSIRTKILNSKIPVFVFIDNNAASAGALISIACDSIYMRPGGSIGAATVVNQKGEQVPDKYQSFMRSTMRATAEAHGKDTIIKGSDTLITWHRNPSIAEAMVDPSIYVENVSDTGKVLTLTAEEAIKLGFCEGLAENIDDALKHAGVKNYELKEYIPTSLDKIIHFLVNPLISGILIMIIIGGIYYELQSPGIGFPLGAAAVAALLYFAPLYLEGLAEHWELLLFLVGIILIVVEIFAIPGFGVAGVSGIILVITGLTLSLVDNIVFQLDIKLAIDALVKALFIVLVSIFMSLTLSLILTKQLFTSRKFKFALYSVQEKELGFVGVDAAGQKKNIGKTGIAVTILRPAGKIEIDDNMYDAISEVGYINKGEKIIVVKDEAGQLYVVKSQDS